MDVVKATSADLAAVLVWLEREYEEDGEGFWCSCLFAISVLLRALSFGGSGVMRRASAVAREELVAAM